MGERDLWAAVILQAADDVRDEPLDSLEYEAAASFFLAGGDWSIARRETADRAGIEPETLAAYGRAAVEARRRIEGLPAAPVPAIAAPAARPAPLPLLAAYLPPAKARPVMPPRGKRAASRANRLERSVTLPPAPPAAPKRVRREKGPRPGPNPFFPLGLPPTHV